MPVQLPSFTKEEQQKLLRDIQKNTLYPYTYTIDKGIDNTGFPNSDGTGSFDTIAFTAPTTLSIIALHVSSTILAASNNPFGICVSFLNTVSFAPSPAPTVMPTDSGNEIYKTLFNGASSFNDFVFFMPNNYYMSKGQQLFIHQWALTATLGTGLSFFTTVMLHTQPTGLQV